jgi:hypothetical protein
VPALGLFRFATRSSKDGRDAASDTPARSTNASAAGAVRWIILLPPVLMMAARADPPARAAKSVDDIRLAK